MLRVNRTTANAIECENRAMLSILTQYKHMGRTDGLTPCAYRALHCVPKKRDYIFDDKLK